MRSAVLLMAGLTCPEISELAMSGYRTPQPEVLVLLSSKICLDKVNYPPNTRRHSPERDVYP